MATQFGFTCPSGGQWYACGGQSKFVGCCTSDPCNAAGCSEGNTRPGGFNATRHGEFPDASCGAGSNFWSCGFATTFWGCCKSDACKNNAVCKAGDLVPAFMDRPDQLNAYAPSPTSSSAAKSDSGSSNGAVIGGAVGGGVAAIIIGVLIFLLLRKRRRNQQNMSPEVGATAMTPMMKERPEDRHSTQYGQSPPPTYSSPNPNYYQSMSPEKGHPHHEYRNDALGPQELPADTSSPTQHRYSELPAESSSSGAQRYSELPAGAIQATAELESPQTSPRPLQTEFGTDLAKQMHQGSGTTSDEISKEKK